MKRFFRLLAVVLFVTILATAQTAKVKRNVNLRTKASSSSKKIETLKPSATLTLITPALRNGYLHVKTEAGNKGWVWKRNVEVQDEGDADEEPSRAEDDVVAKLLAAHTEAVGQPLVINGETVCGPTGKADNDKKKTLNSNKNRTDIPAADSYIKVDWADLRDLPAGRADDLPGAPVTVEGFLVHKIKPEGAESPNCGLKRANEVDWHMYLTDTAGLDDIGQAVIVETTPRTRPLHHWVKADLDKVVNKNVSVRISGWLLYDFEHLNVIGTQRASGWELHPITRIEVKRNGQWVDLDQ